MAADAPFLTYRFILADGSVREFPVRLDPSTLKAPPLARAMIPAWARLANHRCPNCPLQEAEHPYCPAALSVIDIVEAFRDSRSTEQATVEVLTQARAFSKRVSLADGVSALLGVLMPTSGCPVLAKLRPNVLTHLPFATVQETIYRTLTMYLLAQFFAAKRGKKPDWTLDEFGLLIEDVRLVNKNFCQRFYEACLKDVNVNALCHLDCFAELTAGAAKRHERLAAIEKLFEAFGA
ncbi:MAG TPA: hypothetical protein DCM05_10555 [Elusimicrobia bacterium]|nr:hypothetical protein [Elusimicrobiota bacterium]